MEEEGAKGREEEEGKKKGAFVFLYAPITTHLPNIFFMWGLNYFKGHMDQSPLGIIFIFCFFFWLSTIEGKKKIK